MFEKFTLMPMHRHVQKNKFLPANSPLELPHWSGTDTEELFKKHLKTQPADWYYRTHTVRYQTNSSGFRCPEWKDIDWSESVVMFGCSNTYGVGLDDRDTIGTRLSEIINRPVVNMGAGGASMTFCLHNSVILNDGYPAPKAIIYIWPDHRRYVEYHRHTVENFGAWNIEKNNIMDTWTRDPNNARVNAVLIQKTVRAIWKDRVPILEGTICGTGSDKILHCHKFKSIDLSRDLMHSGIETAKSIAKTISENLKI